MASAGSAGPAESSGGRPTSFRALTARQRLLVVAVLLVIPLALFAVAEGVLRVVGYGSSYPLFIPVEPAPGYLMANPAVGRRYFRHEAGTPVPMLDVFRATKGPETYRLVVQGGSTTAGFPYGHGGAFSRMLEQRLQETFPERDIEVVNLGLDATNSFTLLDLAPEIVAAEPDAVLIYAGHNEYYGVLGVASAESLGRSPAVVRAYVRLRNLRTVQWLQAAVDRSAGLLWKVLDRPAPPRRTLMEYLASEHTVPYGSSLYRAGIRQFERNLDDLLALYQDAGIPVFIGTLASNERHQEPFIGGPMQAEDEGRWQRLTASAADALAAGDAAAADTAIRALLETDSTAADPWFLLGRLRDAAGAGTATTGPDGDAGVAYRAARDRDRLPFRAPSAMNDVIREVAGRRGAVVVETYEAMADASVGGVVDSVLMLEHLHPNVDGQFLLADAFYGALERSGEIGPWTAAVPREEARRSVPVTALDSVVARLTISHITSRFPFQPAGSQEKALADTLTPTTAAEAVALRHYRGRTSWLQAMAELEQHYGRAGEWERVAHLNRVLGQELGYSPDPLLTAAQAALLAGHPEAAMRDVRSAARRRATAHGAWLEGNLHARGGDTAAARVAYERAVALDRRYQRASAALQALAALPALEAAARQRPDATDVLADLAVARFMTGRYEEAGQLAGRVLRMEPGHPTASQVSRQLRAIYRSGSE